MGIFRVFAGMLIALLLASPALASTPIGSTSYLPLGGIEQWISINGEDAANPVLLVVHGGPADVQWPNADKYVPWQKYFTVVQWDQRGAGHSYGHSIGEGTPDVNLDRIAHDGVELSRLSAPRPGTRKRSSCWAIPGDRWSPRAWSATGPNCSPPMSAPARW